MAKFQVAGPFPAYGVKVGELVDLDPENPNVQLNIQGGILTAATNSRGKAVTPVMRCPLCIERGDQPPVLESADELTAHYADKHAGFTAPPFTPTAEDQVAE